MSTAGTKSRYTADDLLAMPDGDRYELVDGELVETPVSEESSLIAGWIAYLLNAFILPKRSGFVIPEQSYRCFPDDPNKVRRPDVSFLRAERRPAGPLRHGHTPD
ncbi:MAG TPA: Uma2 family endonuclease, partial [Planctomycetaceae bacterium]